MLTNFLIITSFTSFLFLTACNDSPTSTSQDSDSKEISALDSNMINSVDSIDSIQFDITLIDENETDTSLVDTNQVDPNQVDTSEIDSTGTDPILTDTTSIEDGILTQGDFNSTDVTTTGSYVIQKIDGKLYIELSDDFSSSSAPDLFLVLVKRNASTIGETNYAGFPDEDILILGDIIKSPAGAIREIPITEAELANYSSILYQCILYNHTFGIAALTL